jgi:AraC family transcriptional activator of mtrCDE
VKYGESLGLFDHLHDILTADFSEAPQVKEIFSSIVSEQSQSLSGSDTITASLMTACVVHLLRQLTEQNEEQLPWLVALGDGRLGRAIDKILEDPAAMHSVESLANVASMSRSAFAEKFTAAFKHSPMQFVHQLRMFRSAKLLHEDRYSIDEIAHKIGYSSRSHFSEAFKKQYGKSPAAYRAA